MRARISESFKLLLMTSILIGLLLFIDICVCLPLSTVFTFRLSRQNILDSYFMPEGILLLAKKSGMPPRILYVEILNISSKEFKVIVLENYTNIRGEVGQAQFLARLPGGEILLYGSEPSWPTVGLSSTSVCNQTSSQWPRPSQEEPPSQPS